MNKKLKYTLITVSVVSVASLTGYGIYKYVKRDKTKPETLTASEAQELYLKKKEDTQEWNAEGMEAKIAEAKRRKEEAEKGPLKVEYLSDWKNTEEGPLLQEEEKTIPDPPEEEWIDDNITLEDEGDDILRHDPNSEQALTQFMKMELAEWDPSEDAYQTLMNMFETPFEPTLEGDIYLKESIMDHRASFFGEGTQWVDRVSYADLLLHFTRWLDFNFDKGVRHWAETLLYINGLDSDVDEEELYGQLTTYNEHDYGYDIGPHLGDYGYGFFQLTWRYLKSAEGFAERKIPNEITYQIEFEEFKKMVNADQVREIDKL